MLKRTNKFPVGKEIGGCVYAHRLYEKQFPNINQAKAKLPSTFKYHVVKFNMRNGYFTFIQSTDFNTNHEPSVQETATVNLNPKGSDWTVRLRNSAGWIYHHKWMFVADDYKGFSVRASKKRSEAWTALPNIDKSRIGQRNFWDALDINSKVCYT